MGLKIKDTIFILLAAILFSGIVCGEETHKNLLLGGINQEAPEATQAYYTPISYYKDLGNCEATNINYLEIAEDLDAYYFPMYYKDEASNIDEVHNAAIGVATDQNGLNNEALHEKAYDTIVSYSGGTSSAITALADYTKYGLTCDTLILISPMAAGVSDETYAEAKKTLESTRQENPIGYLYLGAVTKGNAESEARNNYANQIKAILTSDPPVVKHIIVITSDQDMLEGGDVYQVRDFNKYLEYYDYEYDEDYGMNMPQLKYISTSVSIVNQPVTLDTTDGEQGHKDLFFKYAKTHLSNEDGGIIEFNPEDDLSENLREDKFGFVPPQQQKINPIETSQPNTQEISAFSVDSSGDTSQVMHADIPETVQHTGYNEDQSSSSSGTIDAYSEGKKIVEEFFASGEAEVALQEGLLSDTEGSGESAGETGSEESNLAGINFTSIKLNSISVTTDSLGGVNFDLILKAEKAEGSKPGISIQNATRIGATAFLTGLDVPNYKFWVNLNPWEVDRIIDEELGQSEVGKIMLEADLQMKKDFSNYGNPCVNKTGKILWSLLDKKREALVQQCMKKFPGQIYNTDNINFQSVTMHWIIPDKVYVYSNGTQISIINANLTINSESDIDRSSFQVRNQDVNSLSRGCTEELNRSAQEYGEYCENLEENMIQPYVVADINSKEKYKDLRDVYTALALAQWYKSNISPLMDIFRYSRGSSSFSALKPEGSWNPKDIWDKYVYSFKNGEYICWENSTTKSEGRTHTRSHRITTGGVEFDDIGDHLVTNEAMPPEVREQAKKAIKDGIAESQNDVLFGYRLHVDQKKETQITSTLLGSQDSSQAINDSSKENRTISETSLTSKEAQIQSNGTQSIGKAEGNTGLATCPDGWMGPDEDGECWQMQITGAE